MSIGLASDEVAEDYKSSLEDLINSARDVINNLTVIAKENIEHASAISRTLENHIKTTSPNKKLPALYLLDSIVKNVGTPYTLFLSRNLYTTFMNAYSLVGPHIRLKLDEMLQTWKLPIPGSLETKPVFPSEVTRPIEEALQKARIAAFEEQRRQALRAQQDAATRNRQMPPLPPNYRQMQTPPQLSGQYQAPTQPYPAQFPLQGPSYQYQQVPNTPVQNIQFAPPTPGVPNPPAPYQPPRQHQQPAPPVDLPQLHRDIEELVRGAHRDSAANPFDHSVIGRLNALVSLQTLLQQQYHPPEQLQQVRQQVTQLQNAQRAPSTGPGPVSSPYTPPILRESTSQPPTIPHPTVVHQSPPPAGPSQIDIQALMSSRNLANIIASAQKITSTPPLSSPQIPPSAQTQALPGNGASDLLASLTKAGILSRASGTLSQNSSLETPLLSKSAPAHLIPPINDVQLTSASLKTPRFDLIRLLYDSQPNQCTTCGRRFPPTEEGREKRRRHYDWHFRTNQRINEAAKRGQNRSWYVDELEWIKSRDDPEGNPVDLAALLGKNDNNNASRHAKQQFVLAPPTGSPLANQPCPICQEKFDASYNDEASDFVWLDAVKVGSRIYHASCHDEVRKNRSREGTPIRTDTPDSVLGKRKAADIPIELNTKTIRVQ